MSVYARKINDKRMKGTYYTKGYDERLDENKKMEAYLRGRVEPNVDVQVNDTTVKITLDRPIPSLNSFRDIFKYAKENSFNVYANGDKSFKVCDSSNDTLIYVWGNKEITIPWRDPSGKNAVKKIHFPLFGLGKKKVHLEYDLNYKINYKLKYDQGVAPYFNIIDDIASVVGMPNKMK